MELNIDKQEHAEVAASVTSKLELLVADDLCKEWRAFCTFPSAFSSARNPLHNSSERPIPTWTKRARCGLEGQ